MKRYPRGLSNMNKQLIKAALVASAIATVGFGGSAAQAATANADAKATILTQVAVSKTADLDFGTIAIGTSGGTVAVSAGGVRTCGTGLVCSGATTAAGFTITGVSGQNVGISLPGVVTLTGPGGATMDSSLSSSAASMVLGTTNNFTVSGTLVVASNQAAGAYTGAFTATVNYQ
jgi:hypothetical protein